MTANERWAVRGSRMGFECPWFRVRQDDVTLPSGEETVYNVVEHGGWVLVVPLLDDGRVVMERIYRWAHDDWFLECPSGGLDGQTPEAAALRELEEETGYRAKHLRHLGNFAASNGYTNERYDVFVATGLTADGVIERESTEQIEVQLLPLDDLLAMAANGKMDDGPSALAILLTGLAR